MKYYIYSVLDTKVGMFGGLVLDITDDAAVRNFSDGVNDNRPDNKLFRHSEDFALYRIGVFDQDNGSVVSEDKLICLVTASAVKSLGKQMDLPMAVN